MDILLRRFLRAGVRRGLAGNWYWFLLAGVDLHILRRVLNDRASVVSTVTVAPGEQVLITVRDPNSRPGRRRRLTPVPGPLVAGERVLLYRPQGPALPHHPWSPGPPLRARRRRDARRPHRRQRGTDRQRVHRSQLPGAAPDAERRRPQDAPGRPGHLPEGPRGHPHRGRHRPGPACARGGRGLGRPLHDRPARRRVRRRLRAAGGLRRAGRGPTWRPPSGPTRPTGWRSAT